MVGLALSAACSATYLSFSFFSPFYYSFEFTAQALERLGTLIFRFEHKRHEQWSCPIYEGGLVFICIVFSIRSPFFFVFPLGILHIHFEFFLNSRTKILNTHIYELKYIYGIG